MSTSTTAYIAVGSNLHSPIGGRRATIARALEMLSAIDGIQVTRISSLIENPAVGGPPDSPPFLNGAAELHTTLDAPTLLHHLHATERALGRTRRDRWEPRPIDLDLLLFGDQILSAPLTIPHPRMHERDFVLKPLAEIAPDTVHPTLNRTISDLLLKSA